jgi:YD repeat-containing protein
LTQYPQFIGDSNGSYGSGDFGIGSENGGALLWSGLYYDLYNYDYGQWSTYISDGKWHRIMVVSDGATICFYIDGDGQRPLGPIDLPLDNLGWYLGAQRTASGPANFHQGMIQELRLSDTVWQDNWYPSQGKYLADFLEDWNQIEYANQSSPSTFYSIADEGTVVLGLCPLYGPPLYAGNTEQFTATSNGPITWQNPSGLGTISPSGLYTAPSTITTQQSPTITVVSQADSSQSQSATVWLMPTATVAITPASSLLSAWQTVQLTANMTNCNSCAVTWSISPSVGFISASGLYVAPTNIATAQTVTVTATSVEAPSISATATINLSLSFSGALRINAGGPTVVDSVGRIWTADMDYTKNLCGAGSFATSSGLDLEYSTYNSCAYSGTTHDYAIPAPNGNYVVRLKFADPGGQWSNVFSVAINGVIPQSLNEISISALAGGLYLPYDVSSPVTVSSGEVDIDFTSADGRAFVNAIEIAPANTIEVLPLTASLSERQAQQFTAIEPGVTTASVKWSIASGGLGTIDTNSGLYVAPATIPAATTVTITATDANNRNVLGTAVVTLSPTDPSSVPAIRINAGGPTYVDPAGRVWEADEDFTTTCTANAWAVSFALPAGLDGEYGTYRMCDQGAPQMTYQIPVSNMDYLVTLKFAEPNATWVAGDRLFSVSVNGATNSVLNQVDVVANAGGAQKPWDTTVPVSVYNSYITIAFTNIRNAAIINAIEIVPPGTVHVTPSTAALYANQTQQFTATIDGPVQPGVTWTLTPSGAGFISASGLYTAPSVIASPQTVTVTAANALSGEMTATARVTLFPPISLTVEPSAVTLSAGESQQFAATLTNTLVATPGVTWSISPGIGTITQAGVFTAPATIASRQLVTVTATSDADHTKSGSAVVTLSPTPVVSQLALIPPIVGPNPVGATQTLNATLTTPAGKPVSGAAVNFSVSGPNSTSGTAVTGATGAALFTYTGQYAGTDTVQATTGSMVSNTASVSWLVPVQPVSSSTIYGQFFLSDGSGAFDTPVAAKPVFTQWFPTLNFNPPSGTVPGNTSTVDVNTRPFTDITTDQNGVFTGTIPAQGNGFQAGVGTLYTFQAVFTGTYTVAGPADVTFEFFTDDGFIMGIGGGATSVPGGTDTNQPASGLTPFQGLPVMGANNEETAPAGSQFTVHFPAAGAYPYEVDYTECCGGQLVLIMTSGTSKTGVPPSGSLTLTPNTVSQLSAGQSVTFIATATDAAGNPVSNAPIALNVNGDNMLQLNGVTGANGQVSFTYAGANTGTDTVQALGTITGMFAVSNQVTVPWGTAVAPPPGTSSNAFTVTVDGTQQLTLPDTAMYSASASDTRLGTSATFTFAWAQVSGPSTVTFSTPQQAITSVTFPVPGVYVLQVTATDSLGSQTLSPVGPITVLAPGELTLSSGWLASPVDHKQVTGIVPITLVSGETLTTCTLSYYPTANPNAVTILASTATTGCSPLSQPGNLPSNTIALLDTTLLANGSYYILLQATDSNGKSMASGVDILVGGDYKPGRVTTTVTDLVVPAPGIPIQISRTYDSLVRGTSSDFGFGWTLGVNVQLDVSADYDVTLTINGQRRTFYFTPYVPGFYLAGLSIPNMLGVSFASYTPEPGMFGSLTLTSNGSSMIASDTGCVFDWLIKYGNSYVCYDNAGTYNPGGYVYTDPYGRVYTISSTGGLQSIQDLAGNAITVTPTGITSTNGLNVPFVRDSQNRITQIVAPADPSDPNSPADKTYTYSYDANGNLDSVTYPVDPLHRSDPNDTSTPVAHYTYDPTHFYTGGTDPRNKPLPTTTYDAQNRLQTVTNHADAATSYQTSYGYDTVNPVTVIYPDNTSATGFATTITNPDNSTTTLVYDSYGKLLRSADPLGHVTLNKYDANHNLTSVTDPLGHTQTYTYDSNGNKTSATYPPTPGASNTTSYTTYNPYSEPASTTDELGNVRNFSYDANFWPQLAVDSIGPVVSFTFNSNGTMASKAVGYDLTQTSNAATTYTYDTYGNLQSQTDPLGNTTTYAYDNLGRKISLTPPAPAAATTYTYDALGNLLSTTVAGTPSRVTRYAYDMNGNKTSETDPNGHTTTYAYDGLNRLTTVTYPTTPATFTTYTYDYRNNVVDTTAQNGHTTHNVYDAAGRLTSVTTTSDVPADAATTSYTYYDDGRKATETDPRGNVTNYVYDPAGRLTSVTTGYGTPQAATTTYAYDDAGNQTSVTDGNNHTTASATTRAAG